VVELAQNQIYKAFREVGRVMRTVALLRFLADSGLRARVTAATSKAEAYNGFSAWTPVRGADATAVRDRRPGAGPPCEPCHRGDQRGGGDGRPEGGSRCQQPTSGTAVQGAHRRHAEAAGPHLPFAATVFAITPAGPIDWGDLAGGAGYFDQAHFGHEFRAFTGLTPTRYVEVRRRFLREHPGHALDGWPLPAD